MAELPEGVTPHWRTTEGGHMAMCVNVADLPAIEEQARQQERERLEAARKDRDSLPLLDAARALCPDEAHWEVGWEGYVDDASACILAFLAALNPTPEPDGEVSR